MNAPLIVEADPRVCLGLRGSAEGRSPFAGGLGYPPILKVSQDWGIRGLIFGE